MKVSLKPRSVTVGKELDSLNEKGGTAQKKNEISDACYSLKMYEKIEGCLRFLFSWPCPSNLFFFSYTSHKHILLIILL